MDTHLFLFLDAFVSFLIRATSWWPFFAHSTEFLFPIACWCCAIHRKVGGIPQTQAWDEISPVIAIERVYGSLECRQHIEVSGYAPIWGTFYCVINRHSCFSAAKARQEDHWVAMLVLRICRWALRPESTSPFHVFLLFVLARTCHVLSLQLWRTDQNCKESAELVSGWVW